MTNILLNHDLFLCETGFVPAKKALFKGEAFNYEIIDAVMRFVHVNLEPSRSFYRESTSYGLKHKVERCIGQYVANGNLIAAMIRLGYRFKLDEPMSQNCYFNLCPKSVKRLVAMSERSRKWDTKHHNDDQKSKA